MSGKADIQTTAFDSNTYPEVRIPFGAGFDHPTFIARGNVAQIKSQIASFFGTKVASKSGVEVAVEAALLAHGLVNAATLGAQPVTDDEGDAKPKKSIAQKKRSGQPEENTDDIESLVKGATSKKALKDIYDKHKDNITEEQLELFSQRKKELAS